MEIVLSIKEPSDEFRKDVLELLAKHAASVTLDTEWTVERAQRFYAAVPARAQRILREAAVRDGLVPADALRDNDESSLRGHSAPLKQALERGVRKGWWPEGMQPPIEPRGPGFGKVQGYQMPRELVEIFFTAIKTTLQKDTE
ncbi:hypothetical protein OHS70_38550 (plasmid) [Streptomyces sp. NBC_00390]|uniref:hypothetical protein n=1 Tax=Streptomyces sp. NBC_00390 TaxID=2975736 RepID=UPI002E1CBB4A